MNKLKQLPRTKDGELLKEFMANGRKYIIRGVEQSLSIIRLNEFQKWSLVVQAADELQEQYNAWNKAITLADKAALGQGFAELSAFLFAQRENLLNLSERKYHAAMYLCTLFIVREDEDIRNWNIDLAESKIDDWLSYSPVDFFLLAKNTAPELSNLFKKIMEKPMNQQVILSAVNT